MKTNSFFVTCALSLCALVPAQAHCAQLPTSKFMQVLQTFPAPEKGSLAQYWLKLTADISRLEAKIEITKDVLDCAPCGYLSLALLRRIEQTPLSASSLKSIESILGTDYGRAKLNFAAQEVTGELSYTSHFTHTDSASTTSFLLSELESGESAIVTLEIRGGLKSEAKHLWVPQTHAVVAVKYDDRIHFYDPAYRVTDSPPDSFLDLTVAGRVRAYQVTPGEEAFLTRLVKDGREYSLGQNWLFIGKTEVLAQRLRSQGLHSPLTAGDLRKVDRDINGPNGLCEA